MGAASNMVGSENPPYVCCHPRRSGDLGVSGHEVPAFAGMTEGRRPARRRPPPHITAPICHGTNSKSPKP